MMIYSQHYFRRRLRRIPVPSGIPIAITFVLLSICLVLITPPIINGINVDLPKINTQPVEIFEDFKYITLYVNNDGGIIVNNTQSTLEEVCDVIKILYKNIDLEDVKIFIRADKNIKYDYIISLLQNLNNEGFGDITLVGKYINGVQNI